MLSNNSVPKIMSVPVLAVMESKESMVAQNVCASVHARLRTGIKYTSKTSCYLYQALSAAKHKHIIAHLSIRMRSGEGWQRQ